MRPQPKAARREKCKKAQPPRKFETHPLYGEIPLVLRTYQDPAGNIHNFYQWDLDYEPPMPRHAVRGDVRKQNLCFSCHAPMFFYLDRHQTCIQCGRDFVFGAAEQKYWYETLGFYGTSVAIRCPECRRKKRNETSLNQQIAVAKFNLKKSPQDPMLLLSLAEAIVLCHMKTGHGKIEEAITAARKAHRIDSNAVEGMFWEGCSHRIAGRVDKARDLLRNFLATAPRSRQQATLMAKATEYLEELGES